MNNARAGGLRDSTTPAHMTVRRNIWFSRLPMLVMMGFRGFRSKYWCVDDETGACEGVYEWQTRVDADAYAGSIALRFMTNRSIPGSVSYRILERTGDEPRPITVSAVDCALRVKSTLGTWKLTVATG